MAHIQYSISSIYNQTPLERLLYISSTTYGKDWISMLHTHSFTELFYCIDGEGRFCTEAQETPIKRDSLIIINPNIKHTEKSSADKPLTFLVLGIDNLKFEFENNNPGGLQIYHFEEHRSEILPLLQQMLSEVRHKKDNYQQISHHLFMILLLKILRVTEEHFSLAPHNGLPGECEFIKEYIDTHYQEKLSLDKLAELSHLNKYYMSHIFSKAYGISPIHYLLERRILHSKELLENSDFSITQIAHVTGFSSPNYFSQSFKKYTGMTPKGYKNK